MRTQGETDKIIDNMKFQIVCGLKAQDRYDYEHGRCRWEITYDTDMTNVTVRLLRYNV